MKKSEGKRASLLQGVLSTNTKNAGRSINKQRDPPSHPIREVDDGKGRDYDIEVPRKTSPSKVACTDLPTGLAELSLSEQDNKLTPEKENHSLTEVFVTEVSSVNDTAEQETRSFYQEESSVNVIQDVLPVEVIVPEPSVNVSKPTAILLDDSKTCTTRVTRSSMRKKKYLPVQSRYRLPSKKDQTLELSAIPGNNSAVRESQKVKKGSGISHSTPYLHTQMVLDNTAPPADGTILDTTEFKKREQAVKKSDRRRTCISTGDLRNSKSKEPAPLSQLQMDVHYCRQLQMAYLHAQAKQTFEAQEQKAKEKIYAMSLANFRLKREIKDTEQKVQMKEAEMAADQLLRSQVEGLDEIRKKLPQLTVAMSQLTDGINKTAKFMNIKNVIIDEEKHMVYLEESKRLLSEINSFIVKNQPGIDGIAVSTSDLKKTMSSQLSEQKICSELLTSYTSLVNQERSLQAQLVQYSNVEPNGTNELK